MAKKKEDKKTNKDSKKSEKKSGKSSEKNKESKSKKEEKQPEKEINNHEKQLRNFFLVMGFVVLVIAGIYFMHTSAPQFEYKGIKFERVEQGDVTAYKTLIPLYNSKGKVETNYRFFIRNHPEDIKDIPIPEELELRKFAIFNYSNDVLCGGKGNIATANLKQLYSVMGARTGMSSGLNETYNKCDEEGRYNYITIQEGEETKIEEVGPACYEMTFKDCEVLEVTERYMLKMFVQTKDSHFSVENIR